MAGPQNTSSNKTDGFDKDLVTDLNDFHLPANSWTYARNAINNSVTGDLGKLGNEPSNLDCLLSSLNKPYTIIGVIHLEADIFAIYSTDDTNSEIGIFTESKCGQTEAYVTAVNDPCLAFNKANLIKGVSRLTISCNFELYWDDGVNPSRLMNILSQNPIDNAYTNPNSPIPWKQNCVPAIPTPNICTICTNTPQLDCDKIRLAKLIEVPCFHVQKGAAGGTLPNGSYFVAIAYSVKGTKISDYYLSNVQPLFDHANTACSLELVIDKIDKRFDEFICVVVAVVNQQAAARQAGIYSTSQALLSFDILSNAWPAVPVETLPLMNPIANKSDAMFSVNDYLLRTGPTSKEDFNYQPRANLIRAKWVAVEYRADYYRKGGSNTGYLRDETYPFFVRWIYDTGDKSSSYHIPGRPHFPGETLPSSEFVPGLDPVALNQVWFCENTATTTSLTPTTLPDGGIQVGEGFMAYWESSEYYPDEKPQVWNANTTTIVYPNTTLADYNLCNKPIRHHKFPEEGLTSGAAQLFNNGVGDTIRIMGVKFENVLPPVMNDGITPVPGVVGYEILRGSRNGNKTIIAKGIINNMGFYNIEGGNPAVIGLYPNYPYNDISSDPFLSNTRVTRGFSFLGALNNENGYSPQNSFSGQHFTFHSPDTNFTNPYLNTKEIKLYGNIYGEVNGQFRFSEKHPREKIIANLAFLISAIAGIGIAALSMNGKRTSRYIPPHSQGYSKTDYVPISTTTADAETGGPLPTPVGHIGSSIIVSAPLISQPSLLDIPSIPAMEAAMTVLQTAFSTAWDLGSSFGTAFVGTNPDNLYSILQNSLALTTAASNAFSTTTVEYSQEDAAHNSVPGPLRTFFSPILFFNYFTEGTDATLRLLKSIIKYTDFVLRYDSHGFYNSYIAPVAGTTRRETDLTEYIGPQRTNFGTAATINNLYRVRTVALRTTAQINTISITDRTRYKVSDVTQPGFIKNPTDKLLTPYTGYSAPANNQSKHQICSSHYVGLKQRLVNQYGQLTDITEQLIPMCTIPTSTIDTNVPVLFGGDTYIGRYTEKNTFFYFYDWLYGQPDGAQFDYDGHKMFSGLYPRFWANFNEFETSDFTSSITSNILTPAAWVTPSDFYNLDALAGFNLLNIKLSVKNAWMYLFNSGVRDFFVESEINIDLRDWGNQVSEEHYDPYRFTDTKQIFDTALIKQGNYYKYDISLSISKYYEI